MVGKTILHYRIIEQIGQGGMGVVYKAEDARLKREVAIKFLPKHIAANEEERQRFEIEARAAAALNHPNIATIHAIEEVDDSQGGRDVFIVMEYLDGQDLKNIVEAILSDESKPLPMDKVIAIAIQIAEGLQAAHEKGIIHRDLKSNNIMLTEKGRVKILDFGLAKVGDDSLTSEAGTILGTAAYMSPEQTSGEEVDHRTDIWSFGVVLYELLTGELPFQGEYTQAMIYSILNEEPPLLEEFREGISEKLQKIVAKSLAKVPDDRYRNTEALLADLSAAKDPPQSHASQTENFESAPSIAVLPFADISPEKDQEYFCDGMAEELIDSLSKVEGWRVVSRTSVFAFKGKEQDIRRIGKQLNVKHVVEGSVRKAGNRVRITIQLSKVEDGFQLFSEKYDRELIDVFAIQDDIARNIVSKLKFKLAGDKEEEMFKHYTEDSEAYQLYLKGRYFFNKGTSENTRKSIKYFEQALKKDANYALAYSGLADAYLLLGGTFSAPLSPSETMPKAKEAVMKAMEIDDSLAEAHTSLALINFWYDWNWAEAESEFKRALELKPGYTRAYQWYAEYLAAMERHDEALAMIKRAQELDPLSVHVIWHVGKILFLARRYDRALEQCQKALEMDARYAPAHGILRRIYERTGKVDETLTELQWTSGNTSEELTLLKKAFERSGWKGVWQKQLQWAKRQDYPPLRYAELYSLLDEKDHAFEWLEKAYQKRSSSLVYLKVYASFDNLRSDPRYAEFLAKMGLTQYLTT